MIYCDTSRLINRVTDPFHYYDTGNVLNSASRGCKDRMLILREDVEEAVTRTDTFWCKFGLFAYTGTQYKYSQVF